MISEASTKPTLQVIGKGRGETLTSSFSLFKIWNRLIMLRLQPREFQFTMVFGRDVKCILSFSVLLIYVNFWLGAFGAFGIWY